MSDVMAEAELEFHWRMTQDSARKMGLLKLSWPELEARLAAMDLSGKVHFSMALMGHENYEALQWQFLLFLKKQTISFPEKKKLYEGLPYGAWRLDAFSMLFPCHEGPKSPEGKLFLGHLRKIMHKMLAENNFANLAVLLDHKSWNENQRQCLENFLAPRGKFDKFMDRFLPDRRLLRHAWSTGKFDCIYMGKDNILEARIKQTLKYKHNITPESTGWLGIYRLKWLLPKMPCRRALAQNFIKFLREETAFKAGDLQEMAGGMTSLLEEGMLQEGRQAQAGKKTQAKAKAL